jgi:hypothetical protein
MEMYINNPVFNVDYTTINLYTENLLKSDQSNSYLKNQLLYLMNQLLSKDAIYYRSNYIMQLKSIFEILYDNNLVNFNDITLIKLDTNQSKNNEIILLNSVLCYKFIIKIISNIKKNHSINNTEKNISLFITNKIVLTNICPHFTIYITNLNINSMIGKYRLYNNDNIGLIYHYIEPLKINYMNNIYNISNLDDLFIFYSKNKSNIQQDYIDQILFNVFFQIFYSLCVLSKYEISHNDLKPSNIMINGGFSSNNTDYDKYIIKYKNEIYEFNVPYCGLKVKIIDFGLSSCNLNNDLTNPSSIKYYLLNEAGIYNLFSDIYDLHYIINYIMTQYDINYISPKIYELLTTIIDIKYIGKQFKNKFINRYYRLGFPFEIKYFMDNMNICYELNYDQKQNLIITDNILNDIKTYLLELTDDKYIDDSIINMLSDPLDNNKNMILNPFETIKLFVHYRVEKKNNPINKYFLCIS